MDGNKCPSRCFFNDECVFHTIPFVVSSVLMLSSAVGYHCPLEQVVPSECRKFLAEGIKRIVHLFLLFHISALELLVELVDLASVLEVFRLLVYKRHWYFHGPVHQVGKASDFFQYSMSFGCLGIGDKHLRKVVGVITYHPVLVVVLTKFETETFVVDSFSHHFNHQALSAESVGSSGSLTHEHKVFFVTEWYLTFFRCILPCFHERRYLLGSFLSHDFMDLFDAFVFGRKKFPVLVVCVEVRLVVRTGGDVVTAPVRKQLTIVPVYFVEIWLDDLRLRISYSRRSVVFRHCLVERCHYLLLIIVALQLQRLVSGSEQFLGMLHCVS